MPRGKFNARVDIQGEGTYSPMMAAQGGAVGAGEVGQEVVGANSVQGVELVEVCRISWSEASETIPTEVGDEDFLCLGILAATGGHG